MPRAISAAVGGNRRHSWNAKVKYTEASTTAICGKMTVASASAVENDIIGAFEQVFSIAGAPSELPPR